MKTRSTLIFMLLFLCSMVGAQTTHFVKHDASGANNGTSWADAFTDLETAIEAANTDDAIWVAAGTYTPTTKRGGTEVRFQTFQMKNGVEIYGGFAGDEDPATFDLDARDFDANETILSGDLGGSVHVYHVFRHVNLGLNSTAVLDGFTVSGGRADGANPENKGGGMLNSGSSSDNGSSPTIRNCLFTANVATEGGALYNSRYCNPAVSYTTFSNNNASAKGGAVFNDRNNPVFSYCTFNGNVVTGIANNDGGGAMYNNTQNVAEGPVITNCIFNNNTATTTGTNTYGGAIFSSINPGTLEISHSTFTDNTAKYGGAVFHSSGSDTNRDASVVKINHSTFEGNNAEYGGAIFSDRHNTMISRCIIRGNEAAEQSGGYYGRFGSSQLINSLLSGNKSGKHGGGAYFNTETPQIINTTITGNYSGERGGGISMIGGSTVDIKNTIVWGNASPEGNELWLCDNCTANLDYSLYGNATNDVFITSGGSVNATNSLGSDPRFFLPVAATASGTPTTSGVYMIKGTSPAVDAGNNVHLDGFDVTQDLRGGPRIVDGNSDNTATIDIGAYEYNPTCSSNPPISGSGTVADPYIIAEPGNFCWMAQNPADWNKHYKQVVDIDLTGSENLDGGKGLRPIGNSTTKFTGTYNGQGYSISNLSINRPTETNVGLFGFIDGQSTQKVVLQNITLVNVNITGSRNVGALVGMADQWNDITNCHVSGIVIGDRNVGGLAGWGRRTDFLRCSSSAEVSTTTPATAIYHGGLAGHINSTSTVKESFATGNVLGRTRVGGLIGAVGWSSQVENCYARGNVQSNIVDPMMGGLIGEVFNAGVRYSYSTGQVNMDGVTSEYGGLVGNKTTDSNFFDTGNFWDTKTSGQTTSEMGTGKTTTEMQTQSTFSDAGWNFNGIWALDPSVNDGYPFLGSSLVTWTGTAGSNWGDAGNWDAAQVPASWHSLVIPGALSNYPVLDADRTAGNITVASGGSITIPPNRGLTVSGVLTNQAGASGVVIQSDATGTGSLIHHTAGVSATIQRFIPAPSGTGGWDDDYGWHLLSAPVAAQAISGFAATSANDYDFYLWDEADDYWRNYKAGNWNTNNTDYSGASASGNFAVGRGYMVAYAAQQTGFAFTDEVNTTDVSWTDLSFSGTGAADYDKGWHLLGNPFASALNWSAGSWALNGVSGVVKIWDEASRSYVDIVDSETAPRNIIPAAQGFFVQVNDVSNSITIPAAARVHHTETWYKSGQGQGVILTAREAGQPLGQQTMILIEEGASPEFDFLRDGRFLAGHTPLFYSVYGEERLSTKRLPQINSGTVIQLGFGKNAAREFEIVLDPGTLYSGLEVWLVDNKLGKQIPLSQHPVYSFSFDEGDEEQRFELRFASGNDSPTDIKVPETMHDIHVWTHDNTLFVDTGNTEAYISLYDLNGRLLHSYSKASGSRSYTLQLPAGIYVIHVISSESTKQCKVIIR